MEESMKKNRWGVWQIAPSEDYLAHNNVLRHLVPKAFGISGSRKMRCRNKFGMTKKVLSSSFHVQFVIHPNKWINLGRKCFLAKSYFHTASATSISTRKLPIIKSCRCGVFLPIK
jgi:hypothetical protein